MILIFRLFLLNLINSFPLHQMQWLYHCDSNRLQLHSGIFFTTGVKVILPQLYYQRLICLGDLGIKL